MASSSSNFLNSKSKYDAKVKKDEDISKEYNKILHTCLDKVLSDMRMKDETFGRLYRDLYYGGTAGLGRNGVTVTGLPKVTPIFSNCNVTELH